MANTSRSEKFRPVFDFLKEQNALPFILDVTRFEFIGFSGNKVSYNKRRALIENQKRFPIVSTRDEDIKQAALLSSIYKQINPNISPKQISLCDCLNASQIIRFQGSAFLVTTDIHDYPLSVFDIGKLMHINDNGKAIIVAFITFNKEKWENAQKHFEQSGPSPN